MTLVQRLTVGQPDSTTVTPTNSGADMVTPGSDGSLTWKTDAGSGGRTGVRCTVGTTTQAFRFNMTANAQMQFTGKVTTPPSLYATDYPLLAIRHTAGIAERLIWAANGTINFNGGSNTGGKVADSGVLQPSHQYVVSIVTAGASTTSGTATVKFYEIGGTTPVVQQSFTGLNTSTNNLAGVDLSAASLQPGTHGWQDIQFNDGTGSEIPDYVAATTSGRPTSTSSNAGGYTTDTGASTGLSATLADESDTTYVQSPSNPAGTTVTFAFPTLASGSITVKTRGSVDVASPVVTRLVELLQGTTVISSRTYTLTTAITDNAWTLNSTELAAVTNRSNLFVRITDTAA